MVLGGENVFADGQAVSGGADAMLDQAGADASGHAK
jgi:hypothetical protein